MSCAIGMSRDWRVAIPAVNFNGARSAPTIRGNHMKSWRQFLFVAFATSAMLALSGCATSLQPLDTNDVRADVVDITGDWIVKSSLYESVKSGSTLRVVRRGVGLYDVRLKQVDATSRWHAATVKLGDTTFVDLFPEFEADTEKPEGILVIATHVIFVIQKTEQGLNLCGFDHTKLDSAAIEERVAVSSPRNQRLVYVAEPKRLQEFFAKHGPADLQKNPVVVFNRED
jgi:hypothetical protein